MTWPCAGPSCARRALAVANAPPCPAARGPRRPRVPARRAHLPDAAQRGRPQPARVQRRRVRQRHVRRAAGEGRTRRERAPKEPAPRPVRAARRGRLVLGLQLCQRYPALRGRANVHVVHRRHVDRLRQAQRHLPEPEPALHTRGGPHERHEQRPSLPHHAVGCAGVLQEGHVPLQPLARAWCRANIRSVWVRNTRALPTARSPGSVAERLLVLSEWQAVHRCGGTPRCHFTTQRTPSRVTWVARSSRRIRLASFGPVAPRSKQSGVSVPTM